MKLKRKKEITIKKQCFLCYNFTLEEFMEKNIKTCAENWLDAENCPNYTPPTVHINKKTLIIKVD